MSGLAGKGRSDKERVGAYRHTLTELIEGMFGGPGWWAEGQAQAIVEMLAAHPYEVLCIYDAPIYDNRQYSFRVEPWYVKKEGW